MAQWICRNSCYMSGYGCVNIGTVLEFDDAVITPRIKKNFELLGAEEAKEAEERKELEKDMTYRAKVECLKALKVKMPPKPTKDVIDRLFAENAEAVTLPTEAK